MASSGSNLILILFFLSVLFLLSKRLLRPKRPGSLGTPLSNIPSVPSQSWFTGNLGQLFNTKGLSFHEEMAERFGGVVKIHGFFGDEQVYVSDPTALHSMIVKEQDSFEETEVFVETNKAVFGPGLVATVGEHHKRQRRLINPAFAVPQLRRLTPVMYDVSEKLANIIEAECISFNGESVTLDMAEWISRVALETVGQAILGYSFDPLDSLDNNPYTAAVNELIPTIFSLSLVRQFAPFLARLGSAAFRRRVVEWIPNEAVQKVKRMADVMHDAAVEILEKKRKELEEEEEGRDVVSDLLRLNEKADDGKKMSDDELTGQITVLIFGAHDTTASALSRILHVLAQHPDVQSRVRDEVRAAVSEKRGGGDHTGRLGYEEVVGLRLLDAVIKETLRLYPPVPFVRRAAVKDVILPYSETCDAFNMKTVNISAGTTVFVGIASSNRLESLWGSDAKDWKPERWLDGGGSGAVHGLKLPGVFSGIMSFLGGGRSCVGYKFALLEMKILLSVLLSKFEFAETSEDKLVWNLSQIIAPSVQTARVTEDGRVVVEEKKGLPLLVKVCADVNE